MTGTPHDVRWAWQSKDSDLRTGYMAVDGRMSLADLIDHMHTIAPGVDLTDLHVNWATVVWARPATPEELAHRQAVQEAHDRRHEEWERATLAELIAKYGTPKEPT